MQINKYKQEHYDNLNKMQKIFNFDVNKLDKKSMRYLRFKFACSDNYPDCPDIVTNKDLADYELCQVRCRWGYDYGRS
jgi:hypothetical protein